jgi:molecular chaperone IbpA
MKDIISLPRELRGGCIGFNSVFDDLLRSPLIEKYPLDNLYITPDGNYHLELAVAGFSKDDLEVERLNNKLVVRGKKEIESKDINYIRKNISYRSFEKSFTVSNDFKDIHVNLENGMLYIELKKDDKEITKQLLEIVE